MVKKSTKTEAVARWELGEVLIVAEYRGSKADQLKWRDKTTGRQLEAETLRHTVEAGGGSFAVDERLAEGVKGAERIAELQKAGIVKGEKCLVVLTQLLTVKGVTSARGSLEVLAK